MRRVLLAAAAALVIAPSAYAWTWPVAGPVLRPFALADDPYAGGQHRGVDIGAEPGSPVRAPAAGTVSFAGTVPGGGKTITIRTDDGWAVTLLQLGEIAALRGAVVDEGAVIAVSGPSVDAVTNEPHVHLGIRVAADPNGYVDPLTLLPPIEAEPPPPVSQPAVDAEPALPVEPREQAGPGSTAAEPSGGPVAEAPPSAEPAVEAPGEHAVPAAAPAAEPEVAAADTVTKPAGPAVEPAAEPVAEPTLEPVAEEVTGEPTLHESAPVPAEPDRVPEELSPADEGPVAIAGPRVAEPRVGAVRPPVAHDRPVRLPLRAPAEPMQPPRPIRELGRPARPLGGQALKPVGDPARIESTGERRALPLWSLAAALASLAFAAGAFAARRGRLGRPMMGLHGEPERTEDSRGRRLAVRERAAAHRSRGGVRRPVRHLRPVPPPEGERRPDGERYRRARDAGDGRGGQRGTLAA